MIPPMACPLRSKGRAFPAEQPLLRRYGDARVECRCDIAQRFRLSDRYKVSVMLRQRVMVLRRDLQAEFCELLSEIHEMGDVGRELLGHE